MSNPREMRIQNRRIGEMKQGMDRAQYWWEDLQRVGAVWRHPGDPRAPHVSIRGGACSDGFVDVLRLLVRVGNLHAVARELAYKLNAVLGNTRIDWVFGSPVAGIPLATAVAPLIGARNVGFTEKIGDNLVCRFDVPAGEMVLRIEEMTTTGGTPARAGAAILEKNPHAEILPLVGAFLARCGDKPPALGGAQIVPIVSLPQLGIEFNEWKPDECPLCKQGSRSIKNCKRVWGHMIRSMDDPTHPFPEEMEAV